MYYTDKYKKSRAKILKVNKSEGGIICRKRQINKMDDIRNNKKKTAVRMIFLFYLIFSILTNMLNPVTPALFLDLEMPDYMFGVGFACMAIATFIFSPLWGRACRKIGCVNVFALGFLLYGCTQILFCISTKQLPILCCRFFGGVAYSAGVVASMSCLMDVAEEAEKYNFMLYHSAITTVGVALGYALGGIVGSVSVGMVFAVQITTLFVLMFCTKISLKESMFVKTGTTIESSKVVECSRSPMSKKSQLFLVIVFLSSFATTSYDTAFTYYIKAALGFPNYWTGLIRGGIGIIALVVDFTVGVWIIRSNKARKKIIYVFILCSIAAWIAPQIEIVWVFVVANFIFFTFNALYIPVQQALATDSKGEDNTSVAGRFTAVLFAGKVAGSLFEGGIYNYCNQLPFLAAGVIFLVAAFLSWINYRQNSCKVKR